MKPLTSARDRALTRALERWFTRPGVARALPWRRKRTAWSALVAEIMLQQTQAARVAERFPIFLKRFPTPRAMAAAREQEVLALWQGLGYYRRARLLYATARAIVADHRGHVPQHPGALRALPGVGRYTAGAIASIVFNQPEPIVDGNVRRVLARWHAYSPLPSGRGVRGEGASETGDRSPDTWTWAAAQRLVEAASHPGVFNEALMELGATICTPRNPRCDTCPAARRCAAHQLGRAGEFPQPIATPVPKAWHHHSLIIVRRGRMLVEQRLDTGMWAGMWQAPTIESPRALTAAQVAARSTVPVMGLAKLVEFTHQTTHRRITFHVYRGLAPPRRVARSGRDFSWLGLRALSTVPLSNPQRRIVKMATEAS
jgi:A/G-specific adenine glycosylase